MDRTTNSSSTTPGTAAHLVSTSGSMYYLLLLSRGAYSTLAQQASRRLCDLVTQRIRTQAMALVALQGIDNSEVDAEVLRLLQEATPVVEAHKFEVQASGRPPPQTTLGIACFKHGKRGCESNICVATGRTRDHGYFCSVQCADIADCPDLWQCVQTHPSAESRVCVPPEGWASRAALPRGSK